MKPTYSAVFNHPSSCESRFVDLTESQLIRTMLEQGVHSLTSVTRKYPGQDGLYAVEGKEMISIWKKVYRAIRHRKPEKQAD